MHDADDPARSGHRAGALQKLVLLTGLSGAGRSTALAALEDIGFEVIDGMPLALIPQLVAAPAAPDVDMVPAEAPQPLALALDPRTRGFSAAAMEALLSELSGLHHLDVEVVFLEASPAVLLRRYSETRRRHPAAAGADPAAGIAREAALLAPLRERASILIDTSDMTLHDLRAQMVDRFGPGGNRLSVMLTSFSYRHGLPAGADLVFDCRFLRNPHWQPDLRPLDGRDAPVAAHIRSDDRFAAFMERLTALVMLVLPAHADEGKSHLGIALGCTGGRHRSVFVAETLAQTLADAGWQVSIRHRELEGRGAAAAHR